jgi:hypothetical protein
LNHRYSEDLDFFTNANPRFSEHLGELSRAIVRSFDINPAEILITDDFARFFISDGLLKLKVDFVNDVEKYAGRKIPCYFGYIDNPLNILANKLSAIEGRDEPKDYYDILRIAENYAFNWREVFFIAKEKALLNELTISESISTFKVKLFSHVDWLMHSSDLKVLSAKMDELNDDFLLGRNNSLGIGKPELSQVDSIDIRHLRGDGDQG